VLTDWAHAVSNFFSEPNSKDVPILLRVEQQQRQSPAAVVELLDLQHVCLCRGSIKLQ
jgi:hypothetical protein